MKKRDSYSSNPFSLRNFSSTRRRRVLAALSARAFAAFFVMLPATRDSSAFRSAAGIRDHLCRASEAAAVFFCSVVMVREFTYCVRTLQVRFSVIFNRHNYCESLPQNEWIKVYPRAKRDNHLLAYYLISSIGRETRTVVFSD